MGLSRMTIVVALAACANAGDPKAVDPDGPPASTDGSVGDHCAPNEYATTISGEPQLACAPIDAAAGKAVDDHCSVYLGWRDNCDGCTLDPSKWGFAGGDRCTNGVGANNTCTTQVLGGDTVRLFGLDPDGDVDGNDKLYASLHCTAPPAATGATAPCPAGELVSGSNGASVRCAPLAPAVATYVREQCALYLGWQDNCDGCTTAPSKWGHASDASCANGAGADDTCTKPVLAGEPLELFGLSPDGDVDGNDKLHVGLRCAAPAPATSTTTSLCPDGQFVVGISSDGTFTCESPAPAIAQYFADHCTVYLGWRDNCDGCTAAPTKWGTAKVSGCANGAGADNTCTKFTLGGDELSLFGLSPDGDVDGNDALYVGFHCR